MASKIEWTGSTWNPIVGCSVVSPGCTNCYAMKMAARLGRIGLAQYVGLTKPSKAGPVWTGNVRLVENALTLPLRTRKPTTWFVNSMSDLFHESVPDAWIDRAFAVMALCPQHTLQVLTKRSARARAYFADPALKARIAWAMGQVAGRDLKRDEMMRGWNIVAGIHDGPGWPLRNVWLGVSCEDQARADERVPDLLATPAAVRFVSAEPLLGPIDFRRMPAGLDALAGARLQAVNSMNAAGLTDTGSYYMPTGSRLAWVIVGGESGPGARPMHPDWARSIRDQCAAAGVAFFFQQWGAWLPATECDDGARGYMAAADGSDEDRLAGIRSAPVSREFRDQTMWRVGKARAGRLLDGVTHDAMPVSRA